MPADPFYGDWPRVKEHDSIPKKNALVTDGSLIEKLQIVKLYILRKLAADFFPFW